MIGQQPTCGETPQLVVIGERSMTLRREHELAPRPTGETEPLGEVAHLVQVAQLVRAARRLVEVPPAESPGGVLHERPAEVARLDQGLAVDQFGQEPPQRRDSVVDGIGQRRRSAHVLDERFEDVPTGRASTPLEPGLEPLGPDAIEPSPPAEFDPRGGEVCTHELRLPLPPPSRPGHQLAAGDRELEQLGRRGHGIGLGHAHHRAPLELVDVGGTDAGGEVGLAERLLALGVAALVGVEHLGGGLGPAQRRVPRETEQIEGARQGVDPPAVVVGVGQPLPSAARTRGSAGAAPG